MRFILIRCFAVLLAVALVGGNAHARLHLTAAEEPPSPIHHQHHHGSAGHHSDQHKSDQGKHSGCCCDCLGCVSPFNMTPPNDRVAPVLFATTVSFAAQTVVLHGRVLLPEPKPPRPVALI
jgi:hypothetical protein